MHALEVPSRQLMILSGDGGLSGVAGSIDGPYLGSPGPKRAVDKDPQVVMQPGSVVQLHLTWTGSRRDVPRAPVRSAVTG